MMESSYLYKLILFSIISTCFVLSIVSIVLASKKSLMNSSINLKSTVDLPLKGKTEIASWDTLSISNDKVFKYDPATRLITFGVNGRYLINFSGSFELEFNDVERLVYMELKYTNDNVTDSLCASSDQIATTENYSTSNRGACSISYVDSFKAGEKIGLYLGSGDQSNAIFLKGSHGNIILLEEEGK